MARNRRIRRSSESRRTPRRVGGRSPRVTKPRIIDLREGTIRKRKSSEFSKKHRLHKLLQNALKKERNNQTNSTNDIIAYPSIPPPQHAGSSKRPNRLKKSPLSTARNPRKSRRPLIAANNDPIVIDSEDDNSVQEAPLFYVDTKGGFNDKEVPRYRTVDGTEIEEKAESPEEDNLSVMMVETTLEEGEIRDNSMSQTILLNKRINQEEIPISDDEVSDGRDDRKISMPLPKISIDQSVIFCSEVIDLAREDTPKALDYIPIGYSRGSPIGKKRKLKKSKATATAQGEESVTKRMVIIDGNNVAFAHTFGKTFSAKGLEICLKYFKEKGHEVKAVISQYRMRKDKSTDQSLLEELYKAGDILLAPCKNLPGQRSSSYDDRLIFSVAEKFDAVIVSNDNYRDLLTESDSWKKIIETRVVGYTWANDAFFLPDDPYGRRGPKLKDLLECKVSAEETEKPESSSQ